MWRALEREIGGESMATIRREWSRGLNEGSVKRVSDRSKREWN